MTHALRKPRPAAGQRAAGDVVPGPFFRRIGSTNGPVIDPPQHFTEQARGVLRRAEEAARAQHVTYVGVEHVMLGLIADEASAATRALVSRPPR